MLDRGVDPSSEIELVVQEVPVRSVVTRLAVLVAAESRVVGNSVYVGPPRRARVLRTLEQARTDDLLRRGATDPATRRRLEVLRRRQTIDWDDLDSPREILDSVAATWKLTLDNTDLVRHDLWAAARLPAANAAEALSLVLVQLDLTFEWSRDLRGVRLVPIPRQVTLTRRVDSSRRPVAESVALLLRHLPGLGAEIRGDAVVVTGLIEDVERAATLIETGRLPRPAETKPTRFPPLSRRQFTLKVSRAKVADVMRQLEQTGVVFRYDPKQLADAGIKLDRTVAIDVVKARARTFFAKLFDPIGLEFHIDGLTVVLEPKK